MSGKTRHCLNPTSRAAARVLISLTNPWQLSCLSVWKHWREQEVKQKTEDRMNAPFHTTFEESESIHSVPDSYLFASKSWVPGLQLLLSLSLQTVCSENKFKFHNRMSVALKLVLYWAIYLICHQIRCIYYRYRAGSTSCQVNLDKTNLAPWLAAQPGDCPLPIHTVSKERSKQWSHIMNPILTKFVWSIWRDTGLVLCLGPISHLIIWLAGCVGKTKQILSCDWLPAQSRWSYLARSGFPITCTPSFKENPYKKSSIGQACSVKMAGRLLAVPFRSVDRASLSRERKNQNQLRESRGERGGIFFSGLCPCSLQLAAMPLAKWRPSDWCKETAHSLDGRILSLFFFWSISHHLGFTLEQQPI